MKNQRLTLTNLSSITGMALSFVCGICSLGMFPLAFDFFRHAVAPPDYVFPVLCFFACIKMCNATVTLYQNKTYEINWRKIILHDYFKDSWVMWIILNTLYYICQGVFVFSTIVILSAKLSVVTVLLIVFSTFCIEYYLADRVHTYMLKNRIDIIFTKFKRKSPH